MSKQTEAKKLGFPTSKKALKGIFKQLAPVGLGILITELERRFMKNEHLALIDEHNTRMEEKNLDRANSSR